MAQPQDFLKCPECHRKTVSLTIHVDGDIDIECDACGEVAMAYPLHQSPRTYK